jgi:hypothetical protein
MTYSAGQTIAAADYNTLVGPDLSTATNTVNTVWAVGSGSAGYGQPYLTQVAAGLDTVTATQWATLISKLNNMTSHQSGTGGNVTLVSAGQTISAWANITSAATTSYSNRLLSGGVTGITTTNVGGLGAVGWTVSVSDPGSNPPSGASSQTSVTRAFGVRCTFSGPDAVRYFFNAGGQLKFNVSAAQNSSTTSRTNEIISMVTALGGITTFNANTNGGRTGSGMSPTVTTSLGYYTSTFNSNNTLQSLTTTNSTYSSDVAYMYVAPSGNKGSYNGNGDVIDFWIVITSTSGLDNAGGVSGMGFNDSIGVNITKTIDVTWPATTYLANTWGAITVTSI